ncbi:hypothetical protein [Pararhodobacter zhoushanensis]|uniref:hypothetical protein n=1 Tax=Pararhodobacter zhoushanensis TaxID=2479545 RepID=UPI000F8C5A26|nr:hypothetical protein [Pararhodobacter zhoushanensis]
MRKTLALIVALALPGAAQAWEEPARGTPLRADLMDALRSSAEWSLGAPVDFVVSDLRVEGDVAFASGTAQRPGGAAIKLEDTPAYRRGEIDPMMDNTTMQALLQRSVHAWVPIHSAIGAPDDWYAAQDFCPVWGPVLPEICDNK